MTWCPYPFYLFGKSYGACIRTSLKSVFYGRLLGRAFRYVSLTNTGCLIYFSTPFFVVIVSRVGATSPDGDATYLTRFFIVTKKGNCHDWKGGNKPRFSKRLEKQSDPEISGIPSELFYRITNHWLRRLADSFSRRVNRLHHFDLWKMWARWQNNIRRRDIWRWCGIYFFFPNDVFR